MRMRRGQEGRGWGLSFPLLLLLLRFLL